MNFFELFHFQLSFHDFVLFYYIHNFYSVCVFAKKKNYSKAIFAATKLKHEIELIIDVERSGK